jgi:cell wall-associated NlpC family hydrolase
VSAFDPRVTAARPDLAAANLRGKVDAARFAEGTVKRVIAPTAPVRRHPAPDAPLDTEALFGERLTIYEATDEGWCWGQLELDSYVGWIPASALADEGPAATHRVAALRTFVFPSADIKRPPIASLSLGSRVFVAHTKDGFAITEAGGFIPLHHLALLNQREPDFVTVARRFLGTPYLWGGRSSLGIDCSGLVQVALQSAGFDCPRDSDMQAGYGAVVPFAGDAGVLNRGDLVCWKGHIGIVSDPGRLLHANAFHMAVAEEPVAEAIERIRKAGSEVMTVRRVAQ